MFRIHGSFYIGIEDLVPTRLISHLLTRDLPETILNHTYDRAYDLIGSRGDVVLKYRLLKTLESNDLGFQIRRQNCFPNIVVL